MGVWGAKQAVFITEAAAGGGVPLHLAQGAVRSGKTLAQIAAFLAWLPGCPREGDLFAVGYTVGSLLRNVIIPLRRLVGPKRAVIRRGAGELLLGAPARQRCVYLLGANDARAADRLAGATAAGVLWDEVNLATEEIFRVALERMSVPGARLFGTLNPEGPYHWLKTEFLDRAGDVGACVVQFLMEDNPGLSEEFKARLRRQHTGVWYQRRILGLWAAAEGAIYGDVWDEEGCSVDVLPDAPYRRWIGVDYGTGAPFCGLDVRRYQSGYVCVGEFYYDSQEAGGQRTDARYVCDLALLAGREPCEAIFVDPSAASFIAACRAYSPEAPGLSGRELAWWETVKGRAALRLPAVAAENAVLDGIRTVSSVIGAGRFRVLRGKCPQLCRSLAGYVWNAEAQRKGEDVPLKRGDHAADALRYLLYGLEGERRGVTALGPGVTPELVRLLGV